jgi:hypothetical protein
MNKLGDYDRWFKPCKCGYDTARARLMGIVKCWKCGSRLERDYSDRALTVNRLPTKREG